jgi:hypothetical protein
MNIYLFILVLVILVYVAIYLIKKSRENFDGLKLENISEGTKSFDDKLFDDVVMFKSSPTDVSKVGLYECLEKCKGTCVEYGVTGNAFCFPKK